MHVTLKRAVAGLGVVALASAAGIGAAVADTFTADGDTASATNDVTVTDCAAGVTRVDTVSTGVATIASGGGNGNQFIDGSTVTISSSSTSSKVVTSGGGTVSVPAGWTTPKNSATLTKSIGVTVKAGLPSGTYAVTVSADGYRSTNGTNPLQLTATYNVTVSCASDTTAPQLTLPANITTEATGTSTLVSWTASALDAVDGARPVTCTPASGTGFAIGTATVSCSASDLSGNTASGSFTVTVTDHTAPALVLPASSSHEATGPSGALVTYSASASDLVDGAVSPTCSPASGATFPVGTTTVSCSASDRAGNTATGSFSVAVGDSTPPVVTVPANKTVEATGPEGAAVSWTASGQDLVDGSLPASCDPASGSTFALGTSSVGCSAIDTAGNTGHGSFRVTVEDTTAPVLSGVPATQTLEATRPAGASLASFAPTALDLVTGSRPVSCTTDGESVGAGFTYPLDATTHVTCASSDGNGNTATTSYDVTVVDTTGPALHLPGALTAEATSAAGAAVTFTATATDAVDGTDPVTCVDGSKKTVTSGQVFPLGATAVACSSTDSHGNATGPTSFSVTVQDTTAPVIGGHGTVSAEATSAAGAAVTYASPATSDAVDGAGTASCAPASGSTFAIGSTTVTCNATDAHGNSAEPTSFSVVVADTTAPSIAAHDPVVATATSSAGAAVTYSSPSWTDAVSGTGTSSCLPASGSVFPVGTSTVTCAAADAAGNRSTSTFTVTVSFAWSGFFQPIDTVGGTGKDSTVTSGTVFNKVKAGSSVPVKFALGGNMGLGVLASGYPKATAVSCSSTALTDAVEETSTASTGLKYDATANAPYGQYVYTWKTPTTFAGTCQRLEVRLVDGSSYYAFFTFTK